MQTNSVGARIAGALKFILFIAVLVGGWWFFKNHVAKSGEGNAKIKSITPAGIATGQYHCWLTLVFKEYPKGIDTRDVKIVFTSPSLDRGPTTFYWNFIAVNAKVPNKEKIGRSPAPNVAVNQPPPLNSPFDVNFPLQPKMVVPGDADLWMKAELFWGGRKQDDADASVRFLYRTETK